MNYIVPNELTVYKEPTDINECFKNTDNVYVIFNKNNSNIVNLKAKDLLTIYFKKYYNIFYMDFDEVKDFINNNNNQNIKIIFNINNDFNDYFEINLMNYIKNNTIYCNIYFIIEDFWPVSNLQSIFILDIFNASNYKVLTSVTVELLNSFHNKNYNNYKNNIININLWSSYKLAFVEFNNNPINKILISGNTAANHYPERELMKSINDTVIYQYNNNDIDNKIINNNYNKILNNYICCFTSSVYIFNQTENKYINTHCVLLKTFEILASGSLLLMPISEKKYLEKFDIINGVNCLLIDFEKNLNDQVQLIINQKDYINKIRYNGYLHSINNLNSYNKFLEFKKIIDN
jgi:hypothetical protein